MNDIIPGELWFAIAKLDFDVWRALTKTIRVFWLYVQKNGGYKIVEKLFGNIFLDYNCVHWRIGKIRHRFDGLPNYIGMLDGCICWGKRNNKGLTGFYPSRFYLSVPYLHTLHYNGGSDPPGGRCYFLYEPYEKIHYLGIFTVTYHVNVFTDRISFPYSSVRNIRPLDQIWGRGDGRLEYFRSTETSDLPRILSYDGSFR